MSSPREPTNVAIGRAGRSRQPGRARTRRHGNAGAALPSACRPLIAARLSSTLWLERQLNDPYVAEAKRLGYRSRAAFKLLQLDDRFGFLKPGAKVLDLGAAPGGWTQVAVERVLSEGRQAGAGGRHRSERPSMPSPAPN